MSNFNLKNTTQTSNTNSNNNSYPKLMEEVNLYWNNLLEKNEKIKNDIKIIEDMFNLYDSNQIFINAKEFLNIKLGENQKIINQLEEQFFVLKRNFNIN